MSKNVTLVFIIILVSTLMIESGFAQVILKPSVPEFTLKYTKNPYYVPPITSIDPYTGKNITVQEGYTVQNRSIQVIIKNQPFNLYTDSNGNQISLFYNVSSKGHYGKTWEYYPGKLHYLPIIASNNEYTVVSFYLDYNPIALPQDLRNYAHQYEFSLYGVSNGSEVDFQIQGLIGYYTDSGYSSDFYNNWFNGETSNWSHTQTLTINDSSQATLNPSLPSTDNQTTEPTDSTLNQTSNQFNNPSVNSTIDQITFYEIIATVTAVIGIVLVSVSLLIYFKKHKQLDVVKKSKMRKT